MIQPARQIFREYALDYYKKKRDRDILPYVFSPLLLLYVWGILCLLLLAGLITCVIHVPVFVYTPGVVLNDDAGHTTDWNKGQMDVLVLVEAAEVAQIQIGSRAQIEFGTNNLQLSGIIRNIDTRVTSSDRIQKLYHLDSNAVQKQIPPSVAIIVHLSSDNLTPLDDGSLVHARILVGTKNIFSLLQSSAG